MARRGAPKQGYNFPAKAEYRKTVFDSWSRIWGDPANRVIVLLVDEEGLDIEAAIRHGFKDRNIIAVNRSKELLVNAPWRKLYPKVKVRVGELGEVCTALTAEGVHVDGVVADLCGPAGVPTLQSLLGVASLLKQQPTFLLALTIMAAREVHTASLLLALDTVRITAALRSLDRRLGVLVSAVFRKSWPTVVKADKYLSPGNVPMLYAVFAINGSGKARKSLERGRIAYIKDPDRHRAFARKYAKREHVKKRQQEYKRHYYCKNKEQIAAKGKIYREANKEKRAAANLAWRIRNGEQANARRRERWATDSTLKVRHKTWREENKDRLKAVRRAYVAANREKILTQQREYRAKNKAAIAAQQKAWWAANHDKRQMYAARRREGKRCHDATAS